MSQEKTYDPRKYEGFHKEFMRFSMRQAKRLSGKPIGLDEITEIRLHALDTYCYGDENNITFYANRNKGGKWNVSQVNHQPSTPVLGPEKIATDLCLAEALDLLAEKNPAAMAVNRHKHSHPASVALLIGHEFKKDRKTQPPAPKAKP